MGGWKTWIRARKLRARGVCTTQGTAGHALSDAWELLDSAEVRTGARKVTDDVAWFRRVYFVALKTCPSHFN